MSPIVGMVGIVAAILLIVLAAKSARPDVAVTLALSGVGVFMVSAFGDVLCSWSRAIGMMGYRRALWAGWTMGRIRHRQPFRAMKIYAPAFTSLPLLLLSARVLFSPSASRDSSAIYAGVLGAAVAVVWFLIITAPPAVLFLGASQYEEFRIMKRLHVAASCYVISLVDQASLGVLRHYHEHYKGIRSQMPPLAGMMATAMAPFADPTGPRLDSVRTRGRLWRRTAMDLIDRVPIVVIDTRNGGRQVQQEALWMLAPERRDRVLFVVDDDGASPLFDELRRLGVTSDRENLRVVTEDEAGEALRTVTRQAVSFESAQVADAPALRQSLALAQEEWYRMERTYRALLERIRAGENVDRELDADLWSLWAGDLTAPGTNVPLLTSSLDAALSFTHVMLNRRRGKYSYRIDVNIDGSAVVSIGVQDRPGNIRVFESGAPGPLTSPRAVLDALCQALLA